MCKYKRAFFVGLLQITGCMTVVNPSALPYKRVCGNCKLGDIYRQQSSNYHCNLCKLDVPRSFVIHFNAIIVVEDAPSIAAFVNVAWIQAILHKSEPDFLNFYATDRIASIEALGSLVVKGEFHLSPLGKLIEFNESNDNHGVIIASFFVWYSLQKFALIHMS